MKEAVENTQRYIVGCTDKYLKRSITLLEMLTAMDDVSKLTPEQVFVRLSSHPESLRLANRAIADLQTYLVLTTINYCGILLVTNIQFINYLKSCIC